MTKKRTRNKQILLRFSEEEFQIFKEKKEKTKLRNYTDFVLRAVYKLPVFVVDVKPILEVSQEINYIGNNINQIAKIANTTGNIYENDIKDLQLQLEKISNIVQKSLGVLTSAREGKIQNGIYKNSTD